MGDEPSMPLLKDYAIIETLAYWDTDIIILNSEFWYHESLAGLSGRRQKTAWGSNGV